MRKELIEIKEIDNYILNRLNEEDKMVFDVRMIINPELEEELARQRAVHRLIYFFAKASRRRKLENIFRQLMNDKTFSQKLKTIFD